MIVLHTILIGHASDWHHSRSIHVFINRTFASTECKEYYCLPATQRSAGCLLTCNEVDSANANAWQSGRVQKDGQEGSVSRTFCYCVGASGCMNICTRSLVDSEASGARRREVFPCAQHIDFHSHSVAFHTRHRPRRSRKLRYRRQAGFSCTTRQCHWYARCPCRAKLLRDI